MYTVGQLAERSGVPATTLRYYDAIGLLVPRRLPNGHRRYAPEAVEHLRLVQLCQRLGLPLDEVASVLPPGGDRRREVAVRRLRDVDDRIAELVAVRGVLAHFAECEHGRDEGAACAETVGALMSQTGRAVTPAPASAPDARR